MGPMRIIAIGGGGCTNDSDPGLEDAMLLWLGAARPRVGFIGAASGDNPEKVERFARRFGLVASVAPYLPQHADAREAAEWLSRIDLAYVGGGDTRALLSWFRESGVGASLLAAARRGVALAGVSAGAVCWFEEAFSNAGGEGFRTLPGLGLLRGSCCPHFSDEPERQPAYADAIAAGRIGDGLAIDDGVAVFCDETGPLGYASSRTGCAAYRLVGTPSGVETLVLEAMRLGG